MRRVVVLRWAALGCCLSSSAAAEGSAELDLDETPWNGFTGSLQHDQNLSAATTLRVDILEGGSEQVCWRGTGSLTLRTPDGARTLGALASGSCVDAESGLEGAYVAVLDENQVIGSAWDVRVCAGAVTGAACLSQASEEQSGRLWSTEWQFGDENTNFRQRAALNGSLYAVVPGGGAEQEAVIELQMRGVSGARYALRANHGGPSTVLDLRIGRSVAVGPASVVTPEYPLYLNPPQAARYAWITPQVGEVQLMPTCGPGVVLARAPAAISFTSNVSGQYIVVCDTSKDGVYDVAGSADFSAFGAAQVGLNMVGWNGRDNAGSDAAEGNTSCLVRLDVGELHYVAEDVETAYPGLRMYRLEADRSTRTPLRMFWDDREINVSEAMPNGQLSASAPLPEGLDPGAYTSAPAAFYFNGGLPDGNARAWGDFDAAGAGKGNDAHLDQFAAADTAVSAPLSVRVLGGATDADGDGLSNAHECDLGSDPVAADTDGDGVDDGSDAVRDDPRACRDQDADGCDDCAGGRPDPRADGLDADQDGLCNAGDPDADGDGVLDPQDGAPLDPLRCADSDGDGCDDCARGRADPAGDGPDPDGDGRCDPASGGERDGGVDRDDAGEGGVPQTGPADAGQDALSDPPQPAGRGTLSGGALCALAGPGGARGAGALGSLLGLLGLLLARRARPHCARARRAGAKAASSALGPLTAVLALAGSARAQVALDQFRPAPLAGDGFGLSRPDVLGKLQWSALIWLDYANDPLVYEQTSDGETRETRIVADHLVGHAGLALGVAKRLTLFASVPVHIIMQGDSDPALPVPAADGPGVGDAMLGGRVQLSGEPGSRFASALELFARLPTAELANASQAYSGDALGSYEPALLAELRAGRFDMRLRAGARLRQKQAVADLELGQEAVAGFGMRVRVGERVYLQAEGYASTFLDEPLERTTTPAEALFGLKRQGQVWNVGLAAGPGVSRGFGSPDLRVVAMLGCWPQPEKPRDSDADGLLDASDRCPRAAEDKDAFEDTDGCPEPDNDRDGIPDFTDSCKLDAEDTDDFQDGDGCPDLDDDQDGVLDAADACPQEPEDADGFADADGCAEPDNDLDNFLDADDRCPDQAEDFDAFEDSDGCPEEASGKAKLTCAQIEITEAVYFDMASDRVQQRSFDLLDQVAAVLKQAKHVRKLRVEGHTDARGNDAKNLELSRRRAASVARYLAAAGIEPDRLESDGYGESQPLASDQTRAGRAKNRRVEFKVVGQNSQCAQTVTW